MCNRNTARGNFFNKIHFSKLSELLSFLKSVFITQIHGDDEDCYQIVITRVIIDKMKSYL